MSNDKTKNVAIALWGELLGSIESFEECPVKIRELLDGLPPTERVIFMDFENNICTDHKDFISARENDLYPVKAYRLIRSSEKNKE
jgi:hypothetical protein